MNSSQTLQWGLAARAMSIASVVRSALNAVVVVYILGFGLQLQCDLGSRKLKINTDSVEYYELTIFQVAILAAICFIESLVCMELFSAMKLYTATKVMTNITKAFRYSEIWLLVQIFVTPFEGFSFFASGYIVAWEVIMCVRVAGIYVVYNYSRELYQLIKGAGMDYDVSIMSAQKMCELNNYQVKTKLTLDV